MNKLKQYEYIYLVEKMKEVIIPKERINYNK